MKVKLSITLDNETLKMINSHVTSQRFRNKSHAVEYAVRKLLEQKVTQNSSSIPKSKNNPDLKKSIQKLLLEQKKQEGEMNA
jgi:Arc/MetJ-type ribon-helix-helix transcriptional regulator